MSAYFADQLKAGAVDVGDSPRIRLLRVVNLDATVAYLQFYAKPAGGVVVGTTPPVWQVAIGKSDSIVLSFEDDPVPLASGKPGLSMAATTTAGGAIAPVTGLAVSVVTD